ncbi:MAG: tetratricopeptide repeat protein [Bacteroidetes bacterium]|nr:tetratricopeptide repeat protein [Bacteroidota bacterium]
MDLKRLPYLPLHFFYYQFSDAKKRMFLILLGFLLITGAMISFAYFNPYFWSLDIKEVADTSVEEVVVGQVEHNYRTFDLSLNAFRQWINYSAGPLLPAAFPLIVFFFMQIAGWSGLIATATEIKSRWIYFFYFLFILFIHFTDVAVIILPDSVWGARLLEFGIILGFLGMAHVFQMNILRWNVWSRFLVFTGISLIVFGIPFFRNGWEIWHKMSGELYTYLIILTILFLYFIGKEPTNLLVFSATNRQVPQTRLHPRLLLILMIVYLLVVFVMLDEYLNFGLLPFSLGLKPTYLIIISLIFTAFTSQNHYHQVKTIFFSLSSFTFSILSWAIIVGSFIFFNYSVGDEIFILAIERIAITFFFAIGLIHTIFVWGNHRELLAKRVNLYYLMTQGPRVNFYVVWLVGLVAMLAAEGREGWKSINLLSHTLANHQADQAMLTGDGERATEAYRIASLQSPGSIKANFNLASLYVGVPDKLADAVFHYQQATSVRDFPPARINAASLFAFNNQAKEAQQVLEAGLKKESPDPYLVNNLGMMYLNSGSPDSAIVFLKRALLADLNIAAIYSNLAFIYHDHNRPEQARKFFDLAIKARKQDDATKANYLFYKLASGQSQESHQFEKAADYFTSYNQILHQFAGGMDQVDRVKLQSLIQDDQSPDASILNAYLRFQQDSIVHAVSTVNYLLKSYPAYGAKASYLIATAFYQRNVPEMAREYFRKAGEAGKPIGFLDEARMDIDLGRADTANLKLSFFRAEHEEYWEATSKELAMLLKAYGQDVYAQTEWDVNALSFNEKVRIGKYADSLNHFVNALEAFRAVQMMDSGSVVPYLELGKIYNKYRDTLAIENLSYGLQLIDSVHPELNIELARAQLYAGNTDLAENTLNRVSDEKPSIAEKRLKVKAELALAKQDTSQAIVLLDSLVKKNIMATEAIIDLANLYHETGNNDAGNLLITQALEINQENADLWYYYAVFSKSWSLFEDAGYGALKAISLTDDPRAKREINAEFAEEIKIVTTQTQ